MLTFSVIESENMLLVKCHTKFHPFQTDLNFAQCKYSTLHSCTALL